MFSKYTRTQIRGWNQEFSFLHTAFAISAKYAINAGKIGTSQDTEDLSAEYGCQITKPSNTSSEAGEGNRSVWFCVLVPEAGGQEWRKGKRAENHTRNRNENIAKFRMALKQQKKINSCYLIITQTCLSVGTSTVCLRSEQQEIVYIWLSRRAWRGTGETRSRCCWPCRAMSRRAQSHDKARGLPSWQNNTVCPDSDPSAAKIPGPHLRALSFLRVRAGTLNMCPEMLLPRPRPSLKMFSLNAESLRTRASHPHSLLGRQSCFCPAGETLQIEGGLVP